MVSLYIKDGSSFQPANAEVITAAAREIALASVQTTGVDFRDPETAREFFITQFAGLEHEEFCIAFLNVRYEVRAFERMFRGTIDQSPVFPREVVKAVLKQNAASVVIAHNHPSGVASPSKQDIDMTNLLKLALMLFDVRLLDHFIVAGDQARSFTELGYL